MPAPDRFSGVLTPVVTPFKEDYTPDGERLIARCRWLLSQNVGLAVFGTNSEANSLSSEEKIDLLSQLASNHIDPKRMMPGTGCCALSDSVRLSAHAVKLGCSGVLMLPPFYYKEVSDEGLFASYSEVIQQVGSPDLRIYLYHIPPISNVPITLDLIERLIREYPDSIAGIKDSSGEWSNTLAILDRGWDDFRVFAGSESFLLANMRQGGSGCISATANVNPAAIHGLYANWKSDDADDLQAGLDDIRKVFQSYPMIPALKHCAAHYAGDPEWSRVRPPLVGLNEAQQSALISDLERRKFAMPGLIPRSADNDS